MSAPLVINLRDGSVWERRAMTAAGVALYALAGSCKCPEYLMASESELAAQGIAGTADVLPVPVGPGLRSRSVLDRARDALDARMSKDDLRLVLENTIAYAAGLESERHSTNESLDTALAELRWLNTQRGDVALLVERERQCNEECVDIDALESALGLGSDELVEWCTGCNTDHDPAECGYRPVAEAGESS